MSQEKFELRQLIELRDRTIAAFNSLPDRFRFEGMDRDLTEEERVSFAQFNAAILTLRSLDPSIVDMDALNRVLVRSAIVHGYESVFDE